LRCWGRASCGIAPQAAPAPPPPRPLRLQVRRRSITPMLRFPRASVSETDSARARSPRSALPAAGRQRQQLVCSSSPGRLYRAPEPHVQRSPC
jgi:hypothetical protein